MRKTDWWFVGFVVGVLIAISMALYLDSQYRANNEREINKFIGKPLVINNDTFRVVANDGDYLILNNGLLIEYQKAYLYLKVK